MKQTYDFKFLLTYSDRFVEQATAAIFKDQQYLRGTNLKTCTPVKQVNYFIIKYVYESWHAQMDQLHHPYFDYTSAEVQKARFEFMSVLSRHIQLEEKHFRVLAKKATMDTLTLMFYPDLFFKTLIGHYDDIVNIKQDLLPILKYINIHLSVINAFKNGIETEKEVSQSFLEQAIRTARRARQLDNLDSYISSFNQVVELDSSNINREQNIEIDKEEAQLSNLLHEVEKVKPAQKDPFEPNMLTKEAEIETEAAAEQEGFTANIADHKDKKSSLIERLQDDKEAPKPTLHEQFQTQEKQTNNTVLDRLQKQQKKPNFLSTISIIDRTRFQKILFNENRANYDEVMETINNSANYQEVMENFQRYFRDYNWNLTDEVTKDLLAYINNYF